MIIRCKSCEKQFVVPDSAITSKGRLVQCSSCGNQWTQYPLKTEKVEKKPAAVNLKKTKKTPPKKKKSIDTYSEEYLQKKHGIKIIDPSSVVTKKNKKTTKNSSAVISYGFYSYLITFIIFASAIYGLLNLTKDLIIYNFPLLEPYINYFYESVDNLKMIIYDIFSNY
tara:strand:+ start:145 stop:648 length:504 start_codon:yes stop_codon:yes gene_type:complete